MKLYNIGKKLLKSILYCVTLPYHIRNIEKNTYNIFYNMQVLFMLNTFHANVFPQYKNKYQGKSVVLVATGPSSLRYTPMEDAIHVGVNMAFKLKNLKFDYMFFNDCPKNTNINNEYYSINDRSIKFYALLPQRRIKDLHGLCQMQPKFLNKPNAFPILLEDVVENKWAQHLECEPFGDFYGTVFTALQFILYTNPKCIYLVGCDCDDSGHFYDKYKDDYTQQFSSYIKFKKFANNVYPDTKILCINPVGLKGIFDDIYI